MVAIFYAMQLTVEQLNEFKTEYGLKSVLNLRDVVSEAGKLGLGQLANWESNVINTGLQYQNVPVLAGEEAAKGTRPSSCQ